MAKAYFIDDEDNTGTWFDYDGTGNVPGSTIDTVDTTAGITYNLQHVADATHITGNPVAVAGDSGRILTIHDDGLGNLSFGNELTVPRVDPTPPGGSSLNPVDWVATPPHLRRDGSSYTVVWGSWQRTGGLPAIGNRRGVIWHERVSVSSGAISVVNGADELASVIIPTFTGAINANSSQIDNVEAYDVGGGTYVLLVENNDINVTGYLARYIIVDNLDNDALRIVRLTGTNPPEWKDMHPAAPTHVTVDLIEEFLAGTIMARLRPINGALTFVGNPALCVGVVTAGGVHGKFLAPVANSYDLVTALGSLNLATFCSFKKLNNAGDILICSYNRIQVVNYSGGVFTLLQDFVLSGTDGGRAFTEGSILQVRPDEWVYNAWWAGISDGPTPSADQRAWTVVMKFSGNTITSVSIHSGTEYIPMLTNDIGTTPGTHMVLGDSVPDSMINIYNIGAGAGSSFGARKINRV